MDPIKSSGHGKAMAKQLCNVWEGLLEQEGLSPEIEYRIRKMINRMIPLLDKIYLKTVKAQEMILECAEKTKMLQDQLNSNEEYLYFILTDLEKTYEDLLKKTYEFRVKMF